MEAPAGSGTLHSDREESAERVSAVLGGEVTFPVRISKEFEIEKMTCLFERNIIADMTPGKNYTVRDITFSGRLHAVDAHGSLKITNLRTEDGGVYTLQIFDKKNTTRKETKRYELKLFSRVEPAIIPRVIERANGSCLITFNCTVNDSTSVSYSWSGGEVGQSVGPFMSLNLTESASNLTVCCTVKNPACNASACVFPREPCFPERSTKHPRKSPKLKYIVPLAVLASLAVCAVCIGILYKLKSAKGRNDRADISTEYAEVRSAKTRSEGGNHYTRTEENNTKPGIKTIYAAVQGEDLLIPNGNTSTPEKDATTTLYAKLQKPKSEDLLIPNGNTSTPEKDATATLYSKLQKPKSNGVQTNKNLIDDGYDNGFPYHEII